MKNQKQIKELLGKILEVTQNSKKGFRDGMEESKQYTENGSVSYPAALGFFQGYTETQMKYIKTYAHRINNLLNDEA